MFSQIEASLLSLANAVPLEVFAFVASFVEEVVAPIPSPTVMIVSGSFAAVQGYTISGLILLAIIAAFGKVLGALVVYCITDKAEDFVMEKFGRFFGVTHEDVEALGKKLGNGYRDYLLLTFLRALPFMPSVVVSVGSGILKVPLRLFVVSTFLGTIVRDGIYLYVGFVGTSVLQSFVERSTSLESILELLIIVAVVAFLGYLYIKRRKRS